MGIFRRKEKVEKTKIQLVKDKGEGFFGFKGELYYSDIVLSCIRPKVRAIGKLVPQHIRRNEKEFVVNPHPYIKMLLEEPNIFSCGVNFFEQLATQVILNKNAFAIIVRDKNGLPVEMYIPDAAGVEAVFNDSGELFYKFYLNSAKTMIFHNSDVIHIKEDEFENSIFGRSIEKALLPLLNIVATTDQSIVRAVKNSGVIKWLLKFNQVIRPDDLKRQVDDFNESFLSVKNSGGAAGVDGKADAIQVDNKDYVPNAILTKNNIERIYNLFGTNEKIINSTYTEDEWNAYYENEIEPLAIKFSAEFTRKLFSRKERSFGNKIIFTANNLQYASMKTKLDLWQMIDRGAMTANEWREFLNLAPVQGGDDVIRRLDTAAIGEATE